MTDHTPEPCGCKIQWAYSDTHPPIIHYCDTHKGVNQLMAPSNGSALDNEAKAIMTDTPELCGCKPIVPMLPGVTNVKFCPTHAAAFEYKTLASAQGDEIARLREQHAKLLAALEPPVPGFKDVPDLLEWVADRFVHVYGESPNVDFVQTLRERATGIRAAIAQAKGDGDA